jgi:hypothetical protein
MNNAQNMLQLTLSFKFFERILQYRHNAAFYTDSFRMTSGLRVKTYRALVPLDFMMC